MFCPTAESSASSEKDASPGPHLFSSRTGFVRGILVTQRAPSVRQSNKVAAANNERKRGKRMDYAVNDQALDILFRSARTHRAWIDKAVEDDTLRRLYDLMKWGPTSGNCFP